MSVLSDFEDRVSKAVEGVFAGVFRSPVQPAELAKACGKEMDRHRKLGVGKVYVATLYSVLISPADADQLGGFANTLSGELETYLIGYARERDYKISTRPRVRFLIDDDLKLGRFEVIGELLSAEEIAAELGEATPSRPSRDADVAHAGRHAQPSGSPAANAIASDAAATAAPAAGSGADASPATSDALAARAVSDKTAVFGVFDHAQLEDQAPSARGASVTIRGTEQVFPLESERYVLGRLNACDICLPDANASREHAELRREGAGWVLADLGSTNGTLVNGAVIDSMLLRDGDLITIGITELVYRETGS